MLTSRLPHSTCSFASTRRPSSAAPSSSLLPTVVEVSHGADVTPAAHLFVGCCSGKARLTQTANSSSLNCCSSVHQNSPPSSVASVSSSVFSTFRPTLPSDNDVPLLSSSSICCSDCRQSPTSDSSCSFPPPPPPLSPSFLASLSTDDVTVSSLQELTRSRNSTVESSLTGLRVDGHTQQTTTPPAPPPPPPPPPGVVPCAVPPPPVPPGPGHRFTSPSASSHSQSNTVCGRTPRTKLRRLQWHKIADSQVRAVGSGCVWAHVQKQLKADSATPCSVDLERVEELFCVGSSSSAGGHGVTRPQSGPAITALERRKSGQVELFDSRRSLNIGIFLRQFRASNAYEELVGGLLSADSESIGGERLRALLKSLPDDDEMNKVLNYSGDPSRLGPAEKFCRDLALALPNYRLRIEALLLKEEFNQTVDWIKPSIDAVIISARDLRNCRAIRDILCTVLLVGNFLNTGAYTGCAAGFQLQSLLSLRDLRANGGRLSLLHLIVTEVEKRSPGAITEIQEMKNLKEAAQCHIETITGDIAALRDKLRRISSQISGTDNVFRQQMGGFIEFAGDELSELESDVAELQSLRVELAAYFCEDEKTFQLDECIRLFSTFFDSFVRASQENHERLVMEEKAEERRRLRAQQMNAKQQSRQIERKLEDSGDLAESRRFNATHFQQSSSSASATSRVAVSGSVNHDVGMYCSDDLGGHADVAGSSAVLPLRSVSSSGALYSHTRSQDRGSNENDESVTRDGDLLHSLLRAAGTTANGGGADGSGLALRRRRRSNATELDVVVRERTASPVCGGVFGDLGPRTAGRRRSLPTPRLNVRDLVIPRPMSGAQDSSESNEHSKMKPVSSTAVDLTTSDVGESELLSDIDENITASSTSAVLNSSLATNDSTPDRSQKSTADGCPVDEVKLNEKIVNTAERQKSVGNTFGQTSAVESKNVDAVQHDVLNVASTSSSDSIFHQTESVESWSSRWLPRRSQSLRLYRLRDRSAVRGEIESQQLEANVQEFHVRAAPEREALRNRLRKLSQIYAATTDVDETSRTWPASRRPCADGEENHHATPTSASAFPLRCGVDVVSASLSSTSTLQLKYDTDSLSSQKDEGFETASISSDVYLSSSQRSSMCDCDVAMTTMSTLERRTDHTTTKTIDGVTEPQAEVLPPPPPSFFNEPEVEENMPRSGCSEGFVLPPSELESTGFDCQQYPSPNTSLCVANTTSVEEKRLSEANTESSRDESPAASVKNAAGINKKTYHQIVGTRQTRTAPVTPRRGSSLVASSASRNVASTRATTATTSNHAPSTNKRSVPAPLGTVATTSTSGRLPAFQRSTPLRATDDRKSTLCSRGPLSSAFVRQSQTRATIAAPVLRTNKRAAAEARKMKAATQAPTNVTHGTETNTECSRDVLSSGVKSVKQTAQTPCTRQTKAVAKSVPVPPSRGSSSRPTTTTTSTSSAVVPRQQLVRNRTSSSGSGSSTTSASAGPKLLSFRSINSGTTTRQPGASVPCALSKKPDSGAVAATSSSLKMPSNLRHSAQPPNSRLRAPASTKKH